MREMGCLFMCLTFLAGITVSTALVGLVNVLVFFALTLGLIHLFGDRLGKQGLAYAMMGTFFASFLWPYCLSPFLGETGCRGDECLADIFTTPGTLPAARGAGR